MKTMDRLIDIANRIDHMDSVAEWITRETVHSDNTISQSGTLISVIADDVRERLCRLVKEMEQQRENDKLN